MKINPNSIECQIFTKAFQSEIDRSNRALSKIRNSPELVLQVLDANQKLQSELINVQSVFEHLSECNDLKYELLYYNFDSKTIPKETYRNIVCSGLALSAVTFLSSIPLNSPLLFDMSMEIMAGSNSLFIFSDFINFEDIEKRLKIKNFGREYAIYRRQRMLGILPEKTTKYEYGGQISF
jgi:hypothetical protein